MLATEVRNLASCIAEAAKKIKSLIMASVERVPAPTVSVTDVSDQCWLDDH